MLILQIYKSFSLGLAEWSIIAPIVYMSNKKAKIIHDLVSLCADLLPRGNEFSVKLVNLQKIATHITSDFYQIPKTWSTNFFFVDFMRDSSVVVTPPERAWFKFEAFQ